MSSRGGESRISSGATDETRLGPYRELIVNDVGLGKYYEATRLGRTFSLVTNSVTIATTMLSPFIGATGVPIVGLFNAIGSNKAAVILWGFFQTVSGTPPSNNQAYWNIATNFNFSGAASGTIISGRADTFSGSSMRPFNGSSALSQASPGSAIRPLGGIQFPVALGSGYNASPQYDAVDGLVIAPPGTLVAICAGNAAGTNWVVNAAMGWAEVDWPG